MVRSKPWTHEENELLLKMSEEGKSIRAIYDSGAFPGRTVNAIRMQLQRLGASFCLTMRAQLFNKSSQLRTSCPWKKSCKAFI